MWRTQDGKAAAAAAAEPEAAGGSRKAGWEVLGWTTTTSWESVGMLGGGQYSHQVCLEYSSSLCSNVITATTPPFNDTANATDGRVIQQGNSTYPRIGEGTIVRWEGQLILFLSRQTQSGDVGASNITLLRSLDGTGDSWTAPVVVPPSSLPHGAGARANPGAAVIDGGGGLATIVLTYFVGYNHSAASRVWRKSYDGGISWTTEKLLTDGAYPYMTGAHDRLRLLSNKRLVQTIHSRAEGERGLGTTVFTSDDDGEHWVPRGLSNGSRLFVPLTDSYLPHSGLKPGACDEYGFYEAQLVETAGGGGGGGGDGGDGHLLMVARTCTGWLYQSSSSDFGSTWTAPLPVGGVERVREGGIRHPLAPPNLAAVPGGCNRNNTGRNNETATTTMLVLLTEPHFNPEETLLGARQILGLQTSCNRGESWSNYQQLAGSKDNVHLSYMSAFSDVATQALHITSRTGITTAGNPTGTISTAYYRIPYASIV